jgi:hypothetical protein
MHKIIAIGGEPATGKSSLMKSVIKELGHPVFPNDKFFDLPCIRYGFTPEIIILGIYDDSVFSGTDRYAMNIQPVAEKMIDNVASTGDRNFVILFEGDRLFNEKFLVKITSYPSIVLKTFVLKCSQEQKAARHATRDNQNESWLAGRATKVQTILTHNRFLNNRYNVTELISGVPFDMDYNTKMILQEIKNGS